MNAAEFYGAVRREVGPALKACGFRRSAKDSALAMYPRAGLWIKPLPAPGPPPAPDRLIVSFEHSKWGWLPGTGGEFRVHLEVGAYANILEILDPGQRGDLVEVVRGVFGRIRRRHEARQDVLRRMESKFLDPRVIGFMPYWDESDLNLYATLILPWLPAIAMKLGQDSTLEAHFAALAGHTPGN